MSIRSDAVTPWLWTHTVSAPSRARRAKPGRQELWAGAVYLMVWSVLWLAVVVSVLAPLDVFLGGGR